MFIIHVTVFLLHLRMFDVSCQCIGVFKMIPFKNRLVSNYLSQHLNLSVEDCGGECAGTPNCDSFSYRPKTTPSECYLYWKRVWAGRAPAVDKNGVVTYWRLADRCPPEYVLNTTYNICYKAYMAAGDKTTWTGAMLRCEDDGGYLFIGNSVSRLQMVADFVKDLPAYSTLTFFGGTDLHEEGTWEWLDGSTVFNWFPTEPQGNEDCSIAATTDLASGLGDGPCKSSYSFICEIPI